MDKLQHCFPHVEFNLVSGGSSLACSPHWYKVVGHRPAGLPNHHDENGPHQALAVHRLPPQVRGSLLYALFLTLSRCQQIDSPTTSLTRCTPSNPSAYPLSSLCRRTSSASWPMFWRRWSYPPFPAPLYIHSHLQTLTFGLYPPFCPPLLLSTQHSLLTSLHLCPTHLSPIEEPPPVSNCITQPQWAALWILHSSSHPCLLYLSSQTHYGDSDYIIRQGATGDTFFIISEGQVRKRDERDYLLIPFSY